MQAGMGRVTLWPYLAVLLIGAHLTWAQILEDCPLTLAQCYCRRKYSYFYTYNIYCEGVGALPQIPTFDTSVSAANRSYEEFTIRYNTTVEAIQEKAFGGMRIKSLRLGGLGISEIHEEAFDGLEEYLVELYLQDNNLTYLPRGSLVKLERLQYVSLENNRLTGQIVYPSGVFYVSAFNNRFGFLPMDSYKGLNNLIAIYMGNNGIAFVPARVFGSLEQLLELELNDNLLTTVNSDLLSPLKALERLDLSNNNITALQPGLFSDLLHLRHLDLSGNNLRSFPCRLFGVNSNLRRLDLSKNRLRQISKTAFRWLNGLRELYLQDNHLQTLGDNIIHPLGQLTELDISKNLLTILPTSNATHPMLLTLLAGNNRIIRIGATDFIPFPLIVSLDLTNNIIAQVAPESLKKMSFLRTLKLSQNRLDRITPSMFANLSYLELLYLADNRVNAVERDSFKGLTSIWHLGLDGNHLQVVEDFVFTDCKTLVSLSLARNKLQEIRMNFLHGLGKLKTLNLESNSIQALEGFVFRFVPKLEILAMRNNTLNQIDLNAFRHLKHLLALDLAHNNLQWFSTRALEDTQKLEFLKLHQNQILSPHPNTYFNLSGLASLLQLDLSVNQLGQLAIHDLDKALALRELMLRDNPYMCETCDMDWTLGLVGWDTGDEGVLVEPWGMACSRPQPKTGLALLCYLVTSCNIGNTALTASRDVCKWLQEKMPPSTTTIPTTHTPTTTTKTPVIHNSSTPSPPSEPKTNHPHTTHIPPSSFSSSTSPYDIGTPSSTPPPTPASPGAYSSASINLSSPTKTTGPVPGSTIPGLTANNEVLKAATNEPLGSFSVTTALFQRTGGNGDSMIPTTAETNFPNTSSVTDDYMNRPGEMGTEVDSVSLPQGQPTPTGSPPTPTARATQSPIIAPSVGTSIRNDPITRTLSYQRETTLTSKYVMTETSQTIDHYTANEQKVGSTTPTLHVNTTNGALAETSDKSKVANSSLLFTLSKSSSTTSSSMKKYVNESNITHKTNLALIDYPGFKEVTTMHENELLISSTTTHVNAFVNRGDSNGNIGSDTIAGTTHALPPNDIQRERSEKRDPTQYQSSSTQTGSIPNIRPTTNPADETYKSIDSSTSTPHSDRLSPLQGGTVTRPEQTGIWRGDVEGGDHIEGEPTRPSVQGDTTITYSPTAHTGPPALTSPVTRSSERGKTVANVRLETTAGARNTGEVPRFNVKSTTNSSGKLSVVTTRFMQSANERNVAGGNIRNGGVTSSVGGLITTPPTYRRDESSSATSHGDNARGDSPPERAGETTLTPLSETSTAPPGSRASGALNSTPRPNEQLTEAHSAPSARRSSSSRSHLMNSSPLPLKTSPNTRQNTTPTFGPATEATTALVRDVSRNQIENPDGEAGRDQPLGGERTEVSTLLPGMRRGGDFRLVEVDRSVTSTESHGRSDGNNDARGSQSSIAYDMDMTTAATDGFRLMTKSVPNIRHDDVTRASTRRHDNVTPGGFGNNKLTMPLSMLTSSAHTKLPSGNSPTTAVRHSGFYFKPISQTRSLTPDVPTSPPAQHNGSGFQRHMTSSEGPDANKQHFGPVFRVIHGPTEQYSVTPTPPVRDRPPTTPPDPPSQRTPPPGAGQQEERRWFLRVVPGSQTTQTTTAATTSTYISRSSPSTTQRRPPPTLRPQGSFRVLPAPIFNPIEARRRRRSLLKKLIERSAKGKRHE